MECRFILFADAANISREGKLNIAGEFNAMFGDQLPVAWPLLHVVARLEANASEGEDHAAQFKITDDDGNIVLQVPPSPIKFGKSPRGVPMRADIIMGVAGLVLPRHGDYAVDLFVDGVRRGGTTLYVKSTKDRPRGG